MKYNWAKAKNMFPNGIVKTSFGDLSIFDLEDMPYVQTEVITFCRDVQDKKEILTYFHNGDMFRDCVYSALPYENVDGLIPVNTFAAMMITDAKK